jgi:hypothetical protein
MSNGPDKKRKHGAQHTFNITRSEPTVANSRTTKAILKTNIDRRGEPSNSNPVGVAHDRVHVSPRMKKLIENKDPEVHRVARLVRNNRARRDAL